MSQVGTGADGYGRHICSCHKYVWESSGLTIYILNLGANIDEWSTAGPAARKSVFTTHYAGDRGAPMNGLKNLGTKPGLLHSAGRVPAFCHYGQQTQICSL